MQFGFESYGMDHGPEEKYEIYPKNHIYTPFQALLSGDIETIKKRNLTYGTSRNFGEYTVSKVKERLSGEETGHYFEVIQGLDRTKLRGLKENDEKETAWRKDGLQPMMDPKGIRRESETPGRNVNGSGFIWGILIKEYIQTMHAGWMICSDMEFW